MHYTTDFYMRHYAGFSQIGPHMLCHQAEEPSPNTPVHRQIATNIYVSLTLKSCTYIFICHDAVRYRAETNMKFKVQIF